MEGAALSLCTYEPAARNEQRSEAIYCCSTILHAKALAGKKITKNRQNCATFERKKVVSALSIFVCFSFCGDIWQWTCGYGEEKKKLSGIVNGSEAHPWKKVNYRTKWISFDGKNFVTEKTSKDYLTSRLCTRHRTTLSQSNQFRSFTEASLTRRPTLAAAKLSGVLRENFFFKAAN